MDPISVAALVALASGAGGAAGAQAWAGLSELVRRPFRRTGEAGDTTASPPPGVRELDVLRSAPQNPEAARVLADVLRQRAADDAEFGRALAEWQQQARLVRTGEGDVINEISGGTQGNVLQARDVHGPVTFGSPPPAPPGVS